MVQEGRELAVIGLGYIGLPTAVVFAESGWDVTGVDISQRTVDMVNNGELPFIEAGMEEALVGAVKTGKLRAQTDTPKSGIYIVSVPTPFAADGSADLTYIDAAADQIAPQLSGGELVVLESTVPPGVTEYMAQRVLDARSDLSLDGQGQRPTVFFAHAPERVLPGRIMVEMRENDRVIGGLTSAAGEYARDVYATFCEGELNVTDARTAELAKLSENAFRDVNIAFANELSLICDKLGVDVWELIRVANKHPRVNILQPGPGVGGHCIAVDPWFIVAADRENSKLIQTARAVNDGKPLWVVQQVRDAVAAAGEQAKVALLGLAFKPNIDDLRESPALQIAETLVEEHPAVEFFVVEPNVGALPESLERFTNVKLTSLREAVADSHVVVVLVNHDQFQSLTHADLGDRITVDPTGLWRPRA